MPDGIDAAVQRMQPAQRESVLDRIRSEAEVEELCARDDAMLPSRNRRDRRLHTTRRTFGAHNALNVRLVRHARIVAIRASRISTQT